MFGAYYLCSFLGLAYPLYASFKAIETVGGEDDKQWLTYWVAYTFLGTLESTLPFVFSWIPFYYVIKAAVIVWLISPQYQGARVLYERQVRPLLLKYGGKLDPVFQATEMAVNNHLANSIAKTVDKHGPMLLSSVTDMVSNKKNDDLLQKYNQLVKQSPVEAQDLLAQALKMAMDSKGDIRNGMAR